MLQLFFGGGPDLCFQCCCLFWTFSGPRLWPTFSFSQHFSFWQFAINVVQISGRDALSNRTRSFRVSSEDAVFVRCARVEIAAARIAALPELVLLACCFGCSLQLRRRFCSNAARKVSSVTLCGAAGSGSCLALAGRLAPRCAGRQSGDFGVRLASGEVLTPRVTASGHSRPLPVTVLLNCASATAHLSFHAWPAPNISSRDVASFTSRGG